MEKNFEFIIGLVYFSPKIDLDIEIKNFNEVLRNVTSEYPNIPIIIGSDFNARMGDLNQLPEELSLYNSLIQIDRQSLDTTINRNGKLLCECMEENDLILLNGRSKNDSPAQFTYVSNLGTSVIDLVWCNFSCIEKINNFRVTSIPTRSDHLPVMLTLKLISGTPKISNKILKLVWHENSLSEYRSLINLQLLNGDFPTDIDESYELLKQSIYSTANQLGMERSFDVSRVRRGKPWFDGECRNLRKELRNKFKNIKKMSIQRSLDWS